MTPSLQRRSDKIEKRAAIRLAAEWKDKTVTISGSKCGEINADLNDGRVYLHHRENPKSPLSTACITNTFIIRQYPEYPGTVAFEAVAPRRTTTQQRNSPRHPYYLTLDRYGDEAIQDITVGLAAVTPLLTEDLIPLIVQFAVAGTATDTTNFEGAGFNYQPMRATTAAVASTVERNVALPNKLQLFVLVECDPDEVTIAPRGAESDGSFGVKSLFGRYWRCQHWTSTVSQSPNFLEDETWEFACKKQRSRKRTKLRRKIRSRG
jgi:hypothetical protein